MKKIINLIMGLLFFINLSFAGKVATFPELANPKNLLVDNDRVIVTDYPSIYIYSLKDYRLLKKFGSKGQGPGEFYIDQEWIDRKLTGLVSYASAGRIFVNSMGRVSVFSGCGDLLKTLTNQVYGGGYQFQPLGDKFVGFRMARGKKSLFATVTLFDSNLIKEKEIFRHPFWMNGNIREINFFERANSTIPFVVNDGKIFISRGSSEDLVIDVFDGQGNKLNTLTLKVEKIRVPDSFIKRVHSYFRLKFKRGLEHNIKYTKFPPYFPALRRFTVRDKKIYVITYKRSREDRDNEMIILDINGRVLQKVMLPIVEKNPEYLYPFAIQGGKFYQVVENEETEEWELFINEIK